MATKRQLDFITNGLNRIPENSKTCHDVVLALIETGQRVSAGKVLAKIFPTEYDRARKQVMYTCRSLIRELNDVRNTTLSPEAINAVYYLQHLVDYCKKCPEANKRNMAAGKSFCCLLRDEPKKNSTEKFHFKINGKGQIVAQR